MLVFSRFVGYFAEVARLGSIRRAAETLGISPSAIDRQILRAEDELGVSLFERIPSGLRLTAAGELLLQSAKVWEKDYGRLRARMADLKGLRRGQVRIALVSALASGAVPEMVAQWREEFPGFIFSLRVFDNVEMASALAVEDIDFGIMFNPQSSKDLQVRAFASNEAGIVCLPDHAFAGRASLRISHCENELMVLPQAPLAIGEVTRALVNMAGVTLRASAESNDVRMIKSLVQERVGRGILTWLDVMSEVRKGELAFVPLADPILKPLTLALCVVPYRQLSAAASLVLNRVEASFSVFGRE